MAVGAVDGGPASDGDDGELPEFNDAGDVEQGQAGDSSGIDAGGGGVPMSEEGAEPVLRNAQIKPDQEDVGRHYATHSSALVVSCVRAGIT